MHYHFDTLPHASHFSNWECIPMGFFYFRLEIHWIHLIRWEKMCRKWKKNSRLCGIWMPTSTNLLIRSANHYTTETTVSGRHRKSVSSLRSCLTGSHWIHLIQQILCKIGKTRKSVFLNSSNANLCSRILLPKMASHMLKSFRLLMLPWEIFLKWKWS